MTELAESSEIKYQPIKRSNVRARLPMLTDIENLVNWETFNIPTYLYENLVEPTVEGQHVAYWLTTANPVISDDSFIVYYGGKFEDGNDSVSTRVWIGSRPVIKISKTV